MKHIKLFENFNSDTKRKREEFHFPDDFNHQDLYRLMDNYDSEKEHLMTGSGGDESHLLDNGHEYALIVTVSGKTWRVVIPKEEYDRLSEMAVRYEGPMGD